MQNIFPIEAYTKDETGYWRRLPITSGLFFGIFIAIVTFFSLIGNAGDGLEILRKVLISFIVGAVSFGLLYSLIFRLTAMALVRKAYIGLGRFATPLSDKDRYHFRLGCNWMKSKNFAVGGAIFLGNQDMIFVAHNANLPKDRISFVVPYEPCPKLGVADQELRGYKKILFSKAPKLLCIESANGSFNFLVPSAEEAKIRIQKIISPAS